MLRVLLVVAAALLASGASPLHAQPADSGPTAFDADLMRLAEILGALHYLRPICGAADGPRWRSEMQSLLDAEAPGGERRGRLVANFNRGFRGFQQTYRTCTPSASVAVRRYLEEGAKISREITARYSN